VHVAEPVRESDMLRIFCSFPVYNEIELLPYQIGYLNKNGIEYFVFDNMSTDGSWEWLQENSVPSKRFDSGGASNINLNLKLVMNKFHKAKPDWVFLTAPDMFYVHLGYRSLREAIEAIDEEGFNSVDTQLRFFEFKYSGLEKPGADPRLTYFYYEPKSSPGCLLCKFDLSLHVRKTDPDQICRVDQRFYSNEDFACLHYALRHDAKERKTVQYLRRKKAWEEKLSHPKWGIHYENMVKSGEFVFDKGKLSDVRKSKFWDPIRDSVTNG